MKLKQITQWPACVALILFCMALPVAGQDETNLTEPEEEQVEKSWKKSFADRIRRSAVNVEEQADVAWRKFSSRMGFHDPEHIAAYRGYGNDQTIWVSGRLLANKPFGGPQDDDNWWDNLKATYQRWESDEVPGVPVHLTYDDQQQTVVTDDEGYYQAEFKRSSKYPRTDTVLAQYRGKDKILSANHWIMLPSPGARFLVISDMDDTVIHTGITDLKVAAQLTFLNNAKTRKPLTGVGGLYKALARGTEADPVNPIVYLSNSAWNMYDLLRDFLDLNDLPRGPLLLRDIGLDQFLGGTKSTHKADSLRALLNRYPDLPAILIGDSGQHDAELYAGVAEEHADRIAAIYIRDIDPDEDSEYDGKVDDIIKRTSQLGVPFLRVATSNDVAQHLAKLGYLPDSMLDEVQRDVAVDQQRDTLEEAE